ncbi:MAG: DUF1972 domain-containing protein [Bacteroidetes bacterium]|nr:DUF1972 domain-containing protein [Bacteroidota bacterium]
MKELSIGIMGTRGIPNHYGGFEQFAQYLSAGLVQKGHQVSVYCSHTHPYQQNEWKGVQLIHCKDPEHRWGTVGQFFYDKNCIRDSRSRNFDVLLHLGYTSDSIWHRRWPRHTIHIMNMDGLEWKRSKYNRLTRIFLKKAERLAARHADILVADSLGIQSYLQSIYQKEAAYIPYGAAVYSQAGNSILETYNLNSQGYNLLIARMEPENNIEMIIQGHLQSGTTLPLVITGNTGTKHGRYLVSKYIDQRLIFTGSIFDEHTLNDLRYHSLLYLHGHSAGGTNPSLLEAMACGARIAAHDNEFNRSVMRQDADYFHDAASVAGIIGTVLPDAMLASRKANNLDRISTIYSHAQILNQYEGLMLEAVANKIRK